MSQVFYEAFANQHQLTMYFYGLAHHVIYMFQAMQYLFKLSCEIPSGDSACIIGLENSQYDNMTFDWLCHPITRAESFARFSRDDIYKNYIL